jgi:hypothetical protein
VWFVTKFLPVGDPKKKKEAVNHTKVFVGGKKAQSCRIFIYFLEQKFEITLHSTTIGRL